ncbi:hypothetical protein YC2023_076033 [Brassica napus]
MDCPVGSGRTTSSTSSVREREYMSGYESYAVGPCCEWMWNVILAVRAQIDVLMYTASRERDTRTGWFEGRMAVRRTDWIEGCGADRVLTDPWTSSGALSMASVLSVLDGWLETKPSLLVTWVTWGWLAE